MYVLFIAVYVSTLSTVCHSVYKAEQVTASQYSLEMVSKNESAQGCGGLLTANHGYLISPHFPESIPPTYTECSWVIQGSRHTLIRFRFLIINLPPPSLETGQCLGGYVTYGQYDYDSRQVTHQRFCGTEFPPIFMSNGQRAWLTFVSTGTAVKPKLYEGVKVDYTVIDTVDRRRINRKKQKEEREQEYMRMLKYRANDERREKRRLSQLSLPPGMVLPEQHAEDIMVTNLCPPTNVESATKPESETTEEELDPNNNKMGFNTFLRYVIGSQSTDASHDVTEASSNANWSSTVHTMSSSQDQWSFPDGSTGSDHTIVPRPTQRGSVDPIFNWTSESESYDPTPTSSLVPLWNGCEKFTISPPGVSVNQSTLQDYTAYNVMKTGGPWAESEFYFPPLDGTDTYEERTSSLQKQLCMLHKNICHSAPDISTVPSSGKKKRLGVPSGSKPELNAQHKDRVYLETIC